jgi:hypothetical protein
LITVHSATSSSKSAPYTKEEKEEVVRRTNEVPEDWAAGGDVLVVSHEEWVAPDMALEPVDGAAAEVGGVVGPVGRKDAHAVPRGGAGGGGRREQVGASVDPLHVVERLAGELAADDVQGAPPRPVVVHVDQLQLAAVPGEVGEQHSVELLRPWRRHRRRRCGLDIGGEKEEGEERE